MGGLALAMVAVLVCFPLSFYLFYHTTSLNSDHNNFWGLCNTALSAFKKKKSAPHGFVRFARSSSASSSSFRVTAVLTVLFSIMFTTASDNLDNYILRSVIKHVFMPPKLPQKHPGEETERKTNVAL